MLIKLLSSLAVFAISINGAYGNHDHVYHKSAPNFSEIKDVSLRKKTFIDYFQNLAKLIDDAIYLDRNKIQDLHEQKLKNNSLSSANIKWLQAIAAEYGLSEFNINETDEWHNLLERVDIVPISLVVAQAANESAWGTSRFVKLGNNYFGQWCYTKGCGVVPTKRKKGKTHEVQTFAKTIDSLKSYMKNINKHNAYKPLRKIRAKLRKNGQPISGYILAGGLINYSELREKYVSYIRSIITYNHLDKYDHSNL